MDGAVNENNRPRSVVTGLLNFAFIPEWSPVWPASETGPPDNRAVPLFTCGLGRC